MEKMSRTRKLLIGFLAVLLILQILVKTEVILQDYGKQKIAEYMIPKGNMVVAFNDRVIAYQAIPGGTIVRTLRLDKFHTEFIKFGKDAWEEDAVLELRMNGRANKSYPLMADDGDAITTHSRFGHVGYKIKFQDKEYTCLNVLQEQYGGRWDTYCRGLGNFGLWTSKGENSGFSKPINISANVPNGGLESEIAYNIGIMLGAGYLDELKSIDSAQMVYDELFKRMNAAGAKPLPAAFASMCMIKELTARAVSFVNSGFQADDYVARQFSACWKRVEDYVQDYKRLAVWRRDNKDNKREPDRIDDATYYLAMDILNNSGQLPSIFDNSAQAAALTQTAPSTPPTSQLEPKSTGVGKVISILEGEKYRYQITLLTAPPPLAKSTGTVIGESSVFGGAKLSESGEGIYTKKTILSLGGKPLLSVSIDSDGYQIQEIRTVDGQPELLRLSTWEGGNACYASPDKLLTKTATGIQVSDSFGDCQASWWYDDERQTSYIEYSSGDIYAITRQPK